MSNLIDRRVSFLPESSARKEILDIGGLEVSLLSCKRITSLESHRAFSSLFLAAALRLLVFLASFLGCERIMLNEKYPLDAVVGD